MEALRPPGLQEAREASYEKHEVVVVQRAAGTWVGIMVPGAVWLEYLIEK